MEEKWEVENTHVGITEEDIEMIKRNIKEEADHYIQEASDLSAKLCEAIHERAKHDIRRQRLEYLIEKMSDRIAVETQDQTKPLLAWELVSYIITLEKTRVAAHLLDQKVAHLQKIVSDMDDMFSLEEPKPTNSEE